MSIDYGTEWFKVGLIKPGMPLDVALNKDSKRKTQSVVTIRHDERIYGSDAVSLAGRFPQLTYFNLKSILGKPYDDKHAEEYRNRFVNDMQLNNNRHGMPAFLHNGTDQLPVEELIAYQFQNAKKQATDTAGEDVKDVVITVTPFATQHERQAILDAAELAGLNVLALMHDETAVALNYAINRQFTTTPEYHMFYDMGAGSTVASIVSFSNVEVKEGKKRTKSTPQLEVKAVGFDRTLGGHEFDVRLQKLLADGFMDQNKKTLSSSIYDSHGAMARLLKEATRVKQILSANTETMASVEGLHEEKDFKMKVTRKQLESLCQDLLDRVSAPILTALDKSGMTVDNIQSLVLVGGNVRVPAIQKRLIDIVGNERIAKNVNADEAAVLGAAFHGASLSNQFRLTKEIKIKDITSFPIEVVYETESADVSETILFNEFDALNARKTMTFKRLSDFDFKLNYATAAKNRDILDRIAQVKVSGLTDALEKYKEDIKQSSTPPKVRVVFEMSPSGLLSVAEAYVNIELPDNKSFKDKVKSFFGSKEDNEAAQENSEKVKPTKAEPVLTKVALDAKYIPDGPLPLSDGEKLVVKKRIRSLDMLDKQRFAREEAKNNLESFVYRTLDFLYDDTVAIVSTEEQQEQLREQLSETSDWLYDEGEHAETKAYIDRMAALKSLETPIAFRRDEYLVRDETNQKVSKSVQMVHTFIDSLRKAPEEEHYHTDEELEKALSVAKAAEQWNEDKLKQQLALTPVDVPVLTSKDAAAKAKEVDEALMQLLRKKKPKVTKKKDTTPKNDSATDDGSSSSTPDDGTTNNNGDKEGNQEHTHDEL
ncbi:heat shock protein 70 family [Chlamydoabsidia padenii]|nr:heat shock protein 70 family [Chlamydoabsidia padenii]